MRIEKDKWTHKQISSFLRAKYPGVRGFSVTSIQRFFSDKATHKTSRIDDRQLLSVLSEAIHLVGPVYGPKCMTGLLAAHGTRVSQGRVGQALKYINPRYERRTTKTAKLLNPTPYKADYFGHKLHIDQNKKLVMYGVTHICAVDGFSGKIVQFITMPIKNNLEIYEHLLRLTLEYGLWDQIRVDHGKEFILTLYVQEKLEEHRTNRQRAPHLQSTSRQNHPVKRIWVEINGRVNYPVKACLIGMEEAGEIDLEFPSHKFCISWFTIRVCAVGCRLAIDSWNNHPIQCIDTSRYGTRIPDVAMVSNNQVSHIDSSLVPTADEALKAFEEDGGHINPDSLFGNDPLGSSLSELNQRHIQFTQKYPTFDTFFQELVNGNSSVFKEGLLYLTHLTESIACKLNES